MRFPQKPTTSYHSQCTPSINSKECNSQLSQTLFNFWQTSPETAWHDKVYTSVHPGSLWRHCLLLLGHVIELAWVKATGFSHMLPSRGGDAERRLHLIIGLSASVFMLDFRFCPAHTLETAGVCVCACVGKVGWSVSGGAMQLETIYTYRIV